jgi:AsmA protein
MKALRWVLLALGGLILIAVAVVGVFVATFDPNEYKPWIVEWVKQETGRTLTVDGNIGLAFFPRIGATIGKATLSEPNSPAIFARVDDARIGVALVPLLSRQVVVDRLTLNGLAVDLVRHKDGRTNFDDLTGQAGKSGETSGQGPQGPPLAIDVGGIEMHSMTVGWHDETNGLNVRLSNAAVKTGRLASGIPGNLEMAARVQGVQPNANLQVAVTTGYRLDLATRSVVLSSLTATVTGDAQGVIGIDARIKGQSVDLDARAQRVTVSGVALTVKGKDGLDAKVTVPRLLLAPDGAESEAMSADVTHSTPSRTVSAKLQIGPLAARGKRIQISRVDADLTAKQPDLSVQGRLATPVTLDLETQKAQFSRIVGDVMVSRRNIPHDTKATVTGTARADWSSESAAAELVVKLDDSNVDAHWSAPAITFDVMADRLNVDRYFPPSRLTATPGAGGGGAPAEQPFDLSALKSLNATGNVRIGALQVSGIKAEQVALALKAAGARLDVSPISASLYQGSLAGSAAINANDNSFVAKPRLAGISLGPFLRDVAGKDRIEGRGAVVLDVRTSGTTVTALKKALAGTAHVALKDGVIKGVDIAALLRTAQTLLGSKGRLEQQAQGGAVTDFAELTASFLVKGGVAHSEDFQMTSPGMRLTGRGDVDIAEGTLNFTTKVAVTGAVTSLGGRDLAQLAGVAVPLRASGPLTNPTYSVDVQSLATELARNTLQREIERRLGGGKPGAQQPGGAVGDVLRGLFGKPK